MKKVFVLFSLLTLSFTVFAQSAVRHKIALFTPLYLDSAFDASGSFRYERTGARFSNPGLEFYFGAQLALDSLQKRGAPLDVFIYDTKSDVSIEQQLSRPELKDLELVIAHSNLSETRSLADEAFRRKIPFVSATLPNDGGASNNPYLVILNSTLQSHVEGIYRFVQKYHSLDKVVIFRKPGAQEDLIKNHFTEFSKTTASVPLNFKFVDLPADMNPRIVAAQLDSNRKNVCIAGSLDEAFGLRLAQILSSLNNTYPIRLIGMPTWDNMNFSRAGDVEIVYTNPFYFNRTNALENQLASEFATKMNGKPSDLFFRGYETMLRFALLLLDTKKDIASNLTRKGNTVITQFDIQPVFRDKSAMTLDYFENKHLYFIKVLSGSRNVIY